MPLRFQEVRARPVWVVECPHCLLLRIASWNCTYECDCGFRFEVVGVPEPEVYKSNPREQEVR